MLGEALFDRIVSSPSGAVFASVEVESSWDSVGTPDGRIQFAIPSLFEELDGLATEEAPGGSGEFPLLLAAGERRSYTANTIQRDPEWRKTDAEGSLRIHPEDVERLGLIDGGRARLSTRRGSAEVLVEANDRMLPGQIALPNGLGLDYPTDGGPRRSTGVALNELTSTEDMDPFAGTPWHKTVPARLDPVSISALP